MILYLTLSIVIILIFGGVLYFSYFALVLTVAVVSFDLQLFSLDTSVKVWKFRSILLGIFLSWIVFAREVSSDAGLHPANTHLRQYINEHCFCLES